MKKLALLTACWVIISSLNAQMNIDKHINFTGKESLVLDIQIADSIVIHTWNKKEVFAKASVDVNDNKDNEAYLTSFDETGKSVNVKAHFKEDYFKGKNNCNTQTSITWVLFIPENTVFSVNTINANIIIDGVTSEINAKTISGFIDLKYSADRKADLKLKTITGTFYSDLAFSPEKKNNDVPSVITQKLNNGGAPVSLETISGNIYFRKSN